MNATGSSSGAFETAATAPQPIRCDDALQVGEWCFEPQLHRLESLDATVHMEPQVAKLLLFLTENAGRPLTKEEIVAGVWDGRFLSDSALTRTMTELRRALGDDARNPRFIETIPKHGYRLVAEVGAQKPTPAEEPPAHSRSRWPLPVLGLLLTALPAVGYVASRSFEATPSRPSDLSSPAASEPELPSPRPSGFVETPRMVAVLPLTDLSRDPGESFFAEGMTEALVAELAQSGFLGVISKHSVSRLLQDNRPLLEVARLTGVDALIEGSVVRDRDRVRITVKLTDVEREAYSWVRSYEREVGDVLSLQRDVASTITREIQAALAPGEGDGSGDALEPAVYGTSFESAPPSPGRRSEATPAAWPPLKV